MKFRHNLRLDADGLKNTPAGQARGLGVSRQYYELI